MNRASRPIAASQASAPAEGRNPIANATPNTSAVETRLRAMLATTWPVISEVGRGCPWTAAGR